MRGDCVYYTGTKTFEKLLDQEKFVSLRTKNLKISATEMFKVYRTKSSRISSEIFHRHDNNIIYETIQSFQCQT